MQDKQSVAIGICTRRRLPQLTRLLQSLQVCFQSADVSVPIVVIENDETTSIGTVIAAFDDLAISAILEPQIGLTQARNRLLDWADANGVDWLIGLDDDEWVSKDWFAAFHQALEAGPPPQIFMGPCQYEYGEDLSPFLSPDQPVEQGKGTAPLVMTTQNYAIHRSLFGSRPGVRLRFHPAFNESGGEDLEFFLRATRVHQAKAAWVPGAVVHEDRIAARATLGYRLDRTRRNQVSLLRIDHLHWQEHGFGNPLRNRLKAIAVINRNLVFGLPGLLLGLILWPVNPDKGKGQIGRALRRLARVQATFDFWLGRSRRAYGKNAQPN